MSKSATPRTWSVLDDHPIKAVLHIVSAENNTDVAASVYGCDGYQDQDGIWRDQHKRQATAELIVRAVNAHEGLVKALEEIRDLSLDPNARATANAALQPLKKEAE